ncbi:MAG: hypothetical protein PHI94_00380 [Eubacteriaceae bacterium]|jgi:hypothetical protein|nr:hypothetical protein [Eubacteriaceae bacterium]
MKQLADLEIITFIVYLIICFYLVPTDIANPIGSAIERKETHYELQSIRSIAPGNPGIKI